MNETALQTREETGIVPADVSSAALQSALNGDLGKLSGEDRLKFYGKLCEFTGLNPLSKPFDWIQFQGKLTLYPNKGCAEQLRKLNGVTFDDNFDRKLEFGLLIMTVRGSDRQGRRDFATAALPFDEKMPVADRANAIMKLETKAKRRLTLSIAGLTMFARDVDDQEPEAAKPSRVQTMMPETTSDRAALLNAALEKPIDVETISGAKSDTGIPVSQSTPDPEPVKPSSQPETPAPASKVETTVQQPVPGTAAAPTGFAGPDGLLTDDTVQNIEIVLSEKDTKRCIRYLIAKQKLKQHDGKFDLARMDHQAANFILKKSERFHSWVEDWAKAGGDKGAQS